MTSHFLSNWQQCLSAEDYEFLVTYVDNIKNGILNDKMIIFVGPARTGKTTLKKAIVDYLGNELCAKYIMSGTIIYEPNIKKLVVFDDISINKDHVNAIINLIKYKQSIIGDITDINRYMAYKDLVPYSKIIELKHIF
jgi:DNA helicase TIP49 (TBP-interacting protein)